MSAHMPIAEAADERIARLELALRAETAARRQAEAVLQAQQQTLRDLHDTVERHVALRVELTRVNHALQSEISQRELADHARDRSEQRFRQLFNQASDAAFVHDLDGRVVDANEAACASLGYSRAELLTLGVPDFEMTHDPVEGPRFWRELPAGSVDRFEGCHRRKNGSTFPVEIHVSVLETNEGRHLLGLVRDITDRQQSEELLRVWACQQEAVARLGTRALSGGSVDELLREAVAVVGETLGAEICRVHEHLPDAGVFVVRASLDPVGSDVGTVVYSDAPDTFAGYVLHEARPVVIEDMHTEARFDIPDSLRRQGPESAVCVLIGGANPGDPRYGVLGVASRQRRTFTKDDVFFVQSVANVLAAVIVRRRQEEALRQSEERFRLAILHAPFPVLLHASDGEVVKVNHAWTRLTGYQEEDLKTVDDWITRACPPEEWTELRGSLVNFNHHQGTMERPARRIRCADGSERLWDFTRANLDRLPDGRCLRITTAVDVTERHQGEAALRVAKEEAERANRAKSLFLSRMSHELRTPLNAILGFGQLLEMSDLDQRDAMSLNYILKGGRHLLALIDEVLDLSRAETGDLHLTPGDVNVEALAQECVGLVARLAQAREIVCRVDIPPEISLWVDEQRLRQMLLNLLSNAIKYNCPGGNVLVSSDRTPAAGRLRLKVTDTGPGISSEGLARLFVPFERLEQEYGEAEGTGLGLVISRRIAEALGGTLGVESAPGQGSTFWIELPMAPSPTMTTEPPPPGPAGPPPTRAATPNATLLYIEDNVSNLQVVKALLANCRPRWQFLSAQDGWEGLDRARQDLPDLILLDLHLPGIKGDAVLAELRRDPRTQHIPVVMLSADATRSTRERLLADGAHAFISKPFKMEALLERLDDTLLQAALSGQG